MNLRLVRLTDKYLGITLCYLLNGYRRLKKKFSASGQNVKTGKILMIKFAGIGNLIMILPTIAAVKRHYPGYRIDVFTVLANEGVFDDEPAVSNVYYISDSGLFRFFTTYLKAAFRLARHNYEMVLDFEQFAKTSSVFALLVGANERIGFDTPGQGRSIAYTRRVAYMDYRHMTDTFYRIARGAGLDEGELLPVRLAVSDNDRRKVENFLAEKRIGERDTVVAMHVGSGPNMMSQRRWPEERFAELADRLISSYEVRVVFTGAGAGEFELVEKALSMMQHGAVNAVNAFTIKELAAFFTGCRFLVSNDTSAVHIASAVDTPVVGIYGPNTPYLYGPRGNGHLVFYRDLYCSPCITNYNAKISSCRNPICVRSISTEEVFRGIKRKYFEGGPV